MTGKAAQDAYVLLQRAAGRLADEAAQLLKPHGLTPTQYNVLRILRGARPDALACGDIAARLINREPDLTRLLDRLEKLGFTARCREKQDRRIVRVSITTAGLDLLKLIDAPMLALHRRQFAPLDEAALTALAGAATSLVES